LVPEVGRLTSDLSGQLGWTGVAALLLLAYSQGGGTYTGLEAVSNNVNVLAEPRVHTGKVTMLYMALSLAFTAGGIILLYLLWGASPVEGQTLNAVAFGAIIESFGWETGVAHGALVVVLALEAGLLFVAANTGFLGGPAVLANMAGDSWVPHQFRYLSSRLVTENGILVMGVASLVILLWTGGNVATLVVLYSVSVFLTFAVSLFGLCLYWAGSGRRAGSNWFGRLALSAAGFIVCVTILSVLLADKFMDGGWLAILIVGAIIAVCVRIRNHYDETKAQLKKIDADFSGIQFGSIAKPPSRTRKSRPRCFSWVLRGRRTTRALVGPADVPGSFPELHFRQRAHRRFAELRRAGGPRGHESRGERVALLLRQLLQQQGLGRQVLPVFRHRTHRRVHTAGRTRS